MKSCRNKTGLTLIEMLIVIAVIAILAGMLIGIAGRIDNQGKERLMENTFGLLDAALWQFADYGYDYKDADFKGLDFPIDCNDFDGPKLVNELEKALDATVTINCNHNQDFSGSGAMYFFLSRVPESRKTLDKIDKSLVTNEDTSRNSIIINIDGTDYSLTRVIDPWGETLRYDYYDETETNLDDRDKSKRNFPVITSAGPDRKFGTADDITNR